MKTSRLLSGLAAVAMAATSVSAQAGTRAADAGAVSVQPVKMSTVTRDAKPSAKKSELGGSATIIAILAAAAVIAGIVVAVDDDDQSSGAR